MSVNRQQTIKPLLYLPATASLPEPGILSAVQAIVVEATGDNGIHEIAGAAAAKSASLLRFARIGPIETITEAGLDSLLASRIDGVVLAGCRGPADIQNLDVLLRVAEANAGIAAEGTAILAEYATTPQSVLSPHSLAGASPRLAGLIFNASALAEATGCSELTGETDTASVIVVGRAAAVLRAREAGIAAYDVLPAHALDDAAVKRYCATSTRDGFSAVVVQPQQVALLDPSASLSSRPTAGAQR
ncbi:aldolase/citrate lyase family protein [Sinorhizobium sp. 8-89]|uniref:aldolase/citrate lyase family protein n=1 Tax=Sinorhizobium sp. 7-81 TaxID=3049087 RepID=UPI0024C21267|nr:aldolase/citrate lyase family protein [Sinorhizobium sp. 7-81]MDK1388057.1 aldolase/citrate lyase family protein [Sinorhizobium sp. 7-81]